MSKNHWRTGRGYLYSDNDPDVLFDAGYKEYVTVVNSEVWVLAEMDINYLHDDEHEIWNRTTPPELDLNQRMVQEDEYKRRIMPTLLRMSSADPDKFAATIAPQNPENIKYELPIDDTFWLQKITDGVQRAIWSAGAEAGYSFKDTDLTWYALTHALSDNPADLFIEENTSYFFDEIIEKIKRDAELCKGIDIFLKNRSGEFAKKKVGVINFETSLDLFSALHGCQVWVAGVENEDGTWNLEVEMIDTFDFTKLVNPIWEEIEVPQPKLGKMDKRWKLRDFKHALGWTANDMAYFSQKWGVLRPYEIKIHFHMENHIVKEWSEDDE